MGVHRGDDASSSESLTADFFGAGPGAASGFADASAGTVTGSGAALFDPLFEVSCAEIAVAGGSSVLLLPSGLSPLAKQFKTGKRIVMNRIPARPANFITASIFLSYESVISKWPVGLFRNLPQQRGLAGLGE
jgi:hypothetical protein